MGQIDWQEVLDFLCTRLSPKFEIEALTLLATPLSHFTFVAPHKLHARESVLNALGQCRGRHQIALVLDSDDRIEGVVTSDALQEVASLLGRYAGRLPVRSALSRRFSAVPSSLNLSEAIELLRDGDDDFLLVRERSGDCLTVVNSGALVLLITSVFPPHFFELVENKPYLCYSGEQRVRLQ